MKTLLVMTAGQTDIQLVAGERRRKLDGETCGTLHDAIKGRSWSVIDAPSAKSRDIIKELPAGELKLCTPKVDAVLAYLAPALPTSALIFETRRPDARDPRFAGEVMERRLRDRGVENVTRVAFLTGDEQLEDPSNEMEAVIRRSVVATLSDAIARATSHLERDDRVFVATTGGLAAANELINELARLHCVGGPKVIALEAPESHRVEQDEKAVEEKFHPAAGYRARRDALALVEKGNLLGARGAVSHLEGAPGQEWTQVIEWLALFASSLPIPKDCDIPILKRRLMAVCVALRVEFALRAGDIPRAVHGTVAFFEAALWDWLRQRDFPREDAAVYGNLENGFSFSTEPTGEKRKRFKKSQGLWKINDHRPGIEAWLAVLGKPALSAFWQQMDDQIHSLRNDVAHNEPTPELMETARRRMRQAGLWSPNDSFLTQCLVQNALCELGEPYPWTLCAKLIADVRARLLKPS